MKGFKIAIIGAGAAGCFCAIELKRILPEADVTVYERGKRPLAKVAITGGGRCNLTNSFRYVSNLQQVYPRGARLIQRVFRKFGPEETYRWWEKEGVRLVTQNDDCVFPRSQDAQEIVHTLLHLMRQLNIRLLTETPVSALIPQSVPLSHATRCMVTTVNDTEIYDAVVVTTGGAPRLSKLEFLSAFDIDIESPVPSLFALNTDDEDLHELSGTVVQDTHVSLTGTKVKANGPLLITHFGMSGPTLLKLSSHGARHLAACDYKAVLSVNWMQGMNEEEVRDLLKTYGASNKQLVNLHPAHLTARHWGYLLRKAAIPESQRWDALNRKEMNRLVALLTADNYKTTGRRAYKAEFVTCGGVALQNLNPDTLALRKYPYLFMAGEILDVDAITGGFNLQAAWSMGYVAAHGVAGFLSPTKKLF